MKSAISRRQVDRLLMGLCVLCLLASITTAVSWIAQQRDSLPSRAPLPAGKALAARPVQSATTAVHGVPMTISIGSIRQKNVPIVSAVTTGDELVAPADIHKVGIWRKGAPLDSSTGTTLVIGHVNWVGQGDGAFYNLSAVRIGATVTTVDGHGLATNWRVTRTEVTKKSNGVDQAALAGPAGPRRLALVTCGGPYIPSIYSYADNIYIWANPSPRSARPAPKPGRSTARPPPRKPGR